MTPTRQRELNEAAQLASNAAELSALLDERLLFTGPDGGLYTKQDDLDVYRTGSLIKMREWCRQHPEFPFRGVHNQELNDTYYRLVCDAIAKTLRASA